MRVLHLYSNHKWTGPADLALLSAAGLRQRGVEVEWAIAGFVHEGMPHAMRARAVELGLPLVEGLELRRHFHLPAMLRDSKRLRSWLSEGRWDLVHSHQAGDHFVAAMARSNGANVPIVRSLWDGVPKRGWRNWFCMRRCDGLHWPFAHADMPTLGVKHAVASEAPVDQRFFEKATRERRQRARVALRSELGLGEKDLIIGITARIQARRRWPLLFAALARAIAAAAPARELCLAVLGRPDAGIFEQVCAQPIATHGLEGRVHFLGYRSGEAYRDALLGLDIFHLLVPGSDPTCRALREAMALGLPPVVTSAGQLAQIVEHGVSGLVAPREAEHLGDAFVEMANDAALRARLADGAALRAAAWRVEGVSESLEQLYLDMGVRRREHG